MGKPKSATRKSPRRPKPSFKCQTKKQVTDETVADLIAQARDTNDVPPFQEQTSENVPSNASVDGTLLNVMLSLKESVDSLQESIRRQSSTVSSPSAAAAAAAAAATITTGISTTNTTASANPTGDGAKNHFSLATAVQQLQPNLGLQLQPNFGLQLPNEEPPVAPAPVNYGVPSDSMPHVEIVSPALRKEITTGKDVNMACLLIPNYTPGENANRHILIGDEPIALPALKDHRLNRRLTIQEFIKAFTSYKNIMCEAFPFRRGELDAYLRDVVDMSTKFQGFAFYQYHLEFSARAAALLLNHNVKVDWSKRDNYLYTSVFAGQKANTCTLCASFSHATPYCHLATSRETKSRGLGPTPSPDSQHDIKGRQRLFLNGKEICNNYNTPEGCSRQFCHFKHACAKCKQSTHPSWNGTCQTSPSPKKVKNTN